MARGGPEAVEYLGNVVSTSEPGAWLSSRTSLYGVDYFYYKTC
jgi:hypothetical protein